MASRPISNHVSFAGKYDFLIDLHPILNVFPKTSVKQRKYPIYDGPGISYYSPTKIYWLSKRLLASYLPIGLHWIVAGMNRTKAMTPRKENIPGAKEKTYRTYSVLSGLKHDDRKRVERFLSADNSVMNARLRKV